MACALAGAGGGSGVGVGGTFGGSGACARLSRGAMIAFSTLGEPQIGQAISARLACLS